MKISFCILFFYISFVHAADPAAVRAWTNREGKTLEAKVLSVAVDSVTVMTPTGQTHILKLETLSDADQEFVKTWSPARSVKPAAANDKAEWLEDFEKAKTASATSKKPILILFTGSDWCGYCINLEKNVLKKSEFHAAANEKLTLMMVDMPQRKSQSASLKKANRALVDQFKVRGYPTLVLADETGKEFARLGYGGQDAAGFVKVIDTKLAKKK